MSGEISYWRKNADADSQSPYSQVTSRVWHQIARRFFRQITSDVRFAEAKRMDGDPTGARLETLDTIEREMWAADGPERRESESAADMLVSLMPRSALLAWAHVAREPWADDDYALIAAMVTWCCQNKRALDLMARAHFYREHLWRSVGREHGFDISDGMAHVSMAMSDAAVRKKLEAMWSDPQHETSRRESERFAQSAVALLPDYVAESF